MSQSERDLIAYFAVLGGVGAVVFHPALLVLFSAACFVAFVFSDGYSCQHCGSRWGVIARRHMNTAYNDDEANYRTLCRPCHEEENAYWDERWEEVYQDQRASVAHADWWARHG